MVKVFTTNQNGKIEFTKQELEDLLNEVWNDGYNHHGAYWWTSPTITPVTSPTITTPLCDNNGTTTVSNGEWPESNGEWSE